MVIGWVSGTQYLQSAAQDWFEFFQPAICHPTGWYDHLDPWYPSHFRVRFWYPPALQPAVVLNRWLHAFTTFLDRGIRQTSDDHAGQSPSHVHFYFQHDTLEANQCAGVDMGWHGKIINENSRTKGKVYAMCNFLRFMIAAGCFYRRYTSRTLK